MNFVPRAFSESVCARLDSDELKNLKEVSGVWSSTATVYHNKRRNLFVNLQVNHDGTQVGLLLSTGPRRSGPIRDTFGYRDRYGTSATLKVKCLNTAVPLDLDPRYDRVQLIAMGLLEVEKMSNYVSMAKFTNKILPMLRSLAFECTLTIVPDLKPFPQLLTDSIFTELRTCDQLVDINTCNYGEKCLDFVAHHIGSGHLRELRLPTSSWPSWLTMTEPKLGSFSPLGQGGQAPFEIHSAIEIDMEHLHVLRIIVSTLPFLPAWIPDMIGSNSLLWACWNSRRCRTVCRW
uniref:F-box domain-containing protein n=1 Tax=Steinernema glaseri TaxID=37863 RepID=A0A1I8AUN9_9BILA